MTKYVFTDEEVKLLLDPTIRPTELAKRLYVSRDTVQRFRRKHGVAYQFKSRILAASDLSEKTKELAERFNVHRGTIHKARRKKGKHD